MLGVCLGSWKIVDSWLELHRLKGLDESSPAILIYKLENYCENKRQRIYLFPFFKQRNFPFKISANEKDLDHR